MPKLTAGGSGGNAREEGPGWGLWSGAPPERSEAPGTDDPRAARPRRAARSAKEVRRTPGYASAGRPDRRPQESRVRVRRTPEVASAGLPGTRPQDAPTASAGLPNALVERVRRTPEVASAGRPNRVRSASAGCLEPLPQAPPRTVFAPLPEARPQDSRSGVRRTPGQASAGLPFRRPQDSRMGVGVRGGARRETWRLSVRRGARRGSRRRWGRGRSRGCRGSGRRGGAR